MTGMICSCFNPIASKNFRFSRGSLHKSAAYTVKPYSLAKKTLVSPSPLPKSQTTAFSGMRWFKSNSSSSFTGLGPIIFFCRAGVLYFSLRIYFIFGSPSLFKNDPRRCCGKNIQYADSAIGRESLSPLTNRIYSPANRAEHKIQGQAVGDLPP